ncbi:hypothetical protein AYI68_g7151 [Smittium mucronatum]|uniref:Uncharacterized protein n=1 Tax=Smittium mucronatum TaxID=133383 RepID=A0A1R0GPG6_9FUNG|nr:hypothetical protein AYI68_g7151 [Smittium mucronatum]
MGFLRASGIHIVDDVRSPTDKGVVNIVIVASKKKVDDIQVSIIIQRNPNTPTPKGRMIGVTMEYNFGACTDYIVAHAF